MKEDRLEHCHVLSVVETLWVIDKGSRTESNLIETQEKRSCFILTRFANALGYIEVN